MKNLSEITNNEWAELMIFIDKKIYGKSEYPHLQGLVNYKEEVMASLRHIKDNGAEKIRVSKIETIITPEFLPFFVVKYLQEKGYLLELFLPIKI